MQVKEGGVDLDSRVCLSGKRPVTRERRAARVGRRSYAPAACGAYARPRGRSRLASASALAWLSLARTPVIPTNHGLRGLTTDYPSGFTRRACCRLGRCRYCLT